MLLINLSFILVCTMHAALRRKWGKTSEISDWKLKAV